jgi:hypothetical protein
MKVGTWLRQVAAYRTQLPIEERLEALLWSWPIRRAITTASPNPLWDCWRDDEEMLQRKAAVLLRLDSLEQGWYPFQSPSTIDNIDFERTCRDICDQLRELPDVTVPDPDDDPRWLALLLEARWGDGQFGYRRDAQHEVVVRLSAPVRRQVCEIGERARDAAYLSVRCDRLLDAVRGTKKSMEQFIPWLQAAEKHAPFVEVQIACGAEPNRGSTEWLFHEDLAAFSAAFQVVTARSKRVTEYLLHAFDSLRKDEGRDRRAQAGRPTRPWVARADRALKDLKRRPLDREDLLMAWSLKSLPDDLP